MNVHSTLELLSDVIDELKAGQEHFRVLAEAESNRAVDWLRRFPEIISGQIDWSQFPARVCRPWETYDVRAAALDEVCWAVGLADATVIIIWGNALTPCVEIPLAVVQRHAEVILSADLDTWLICPSEGWCIEVWHDGEICFGQLNPSGGKNRSG